MSKYYLGTKDFEEIEALIKVTTAISNYYQILYNLEINGKKDEEEYLKILENFRMELEFENQLYNKYFHLNSDKCNAWIEFLFETKMPKKIEKDIESMMKQDYDNRIIMRILNVLIKKSVENYQNVKSMVPETIIELLNQTGIPNADDCLVQSAYKHIKINEALEIDTINAYLTILQECITQKEYKSFKKELINSKYNIIFINKDIEKNILSNNFNIPDTLYVNSKMIADFYDIDEFIYESLKDYYNTQISGQQLSQIIEIGDMDYSIPKTAVTSILRQCLMRATFMLMSDECLSDINYTFNETIEDKQYLLRHPNDKISIQLITNCFKTIKKDKTKPHVLSLTYKKNK